MQIPHGLAHTLKLPLLYAYHWCKARQYGRSQSNESQILADLMEQTAAPRSFIEFGFHPSEFNCIALINSARGLLIDGDAETVRLASFVLPKNIEVANSFLTLDNLDFIRNKFDQV